MLKCRRLHIIIMLVLNCCTMNILGANIVVNAPHTVGRNERFRIEYIVEDGYAGGVFEAPETPTGLKKLYGPTYSTLGRGKSNGNRVVYTILYEATSPGRIKLPPAHYIQGGSTSTSRSVTLIVSDKVSTGKTVTQSNDKTNSPTLYASPMTQTAGKGVSANDVMVKVSLSKDRVMEHDAVHCSIKLYTKYRISSFLCTKLPAFKDFLIQEIEGEPQLNRVEVLNGEKYMTAILKQYILFPQRAGKLMVSTGDFDVKVIQFDVYKTILGSVSKPNEKSITVRSQSPSIDVLPLPSPKPTNFSGAVGVFTLNSSITGEPLQTYKPAILTLKLSGEGNLKYVSAPQLKFPNQFETFKVTNKIEVSPSGNSMKGSVVFSYKFTPQYAGTFTMPIKDFVYYNTQKKGYDTIQLAQVQFRVQLASGVPSQRYANMKKDIIEYDSSSDGKSLPDIFLISKWYYYIAYVLLLMLAWIGYKIDLNDNGVRRMLSKRYHLQQISKQMDRLPSTREGFKELNKLIVEYLSSTLQTDPLLLRGTELNATLLTCGVDAKLVEELEHVISQCQSALYSPDSELLDINEVVGQVKRILTNIGHHD